MENTIIAIAFFILLVIAIVQYHKNKKANKPQFLLLSITTGIPGTFFFTSKYNTMNTVTFVDTLAMGKGIIATFTLPLNAAGNRPSLKEGSLRAESTNAEVATAELGEVDAEAGTYQLKIGYTGKKGSADCKLIASGDLDNSGDPDFEGLVTSVITTEEASSFGEPVISELQ